MPQLLFSTNSTSYLTVALAVLPKGTTIPSQWTNMSLKENKMQNEEYEKSRSNS